MKPKVKRTTSSRPTDGVPPEAGARATHFVPGGRHVRLAIYEQLQTDGYPVTVVDERYDSADVPGVEGSSTSVEIITRAGPETDAAVVVGTRSDARTFPSARLVRVDVDAPRTVVLVDHPVLSGTDLEHT